MDTLLSLEGGLVGLLAASFLAATLVPLSSEAALFGFLRLHPEHVAAAIAVATFGNTAGGMTTYLIGRLLPARVQARIDPRALGWLRRYGAAATLLTWLPLVGDALAAAAGWLRINWVAALVFMALGRFARYALVASL